MTLPRARPWRAGKSGLRLLARVTPRSAREGVDGVADSADGPAVFLIFVLGFTLVPLALGLEVLFAPPLWVHGVLWSVVTLGLTLGSLRPLKACVLALQYRYRPEDFK